MDNSLLIIFCTGFFTNLLLTILLRNFSLKKNFLLSQGIPVVGGVGMGLVLLLSCSLPGISLPASVRGLLIASSVMLAFGVIDDIRELSIIAKFAVQIIAAIIAISFGVKTEIARFGETLNFLITLVWIIGITNALNHLDVMDGVAGGVTLIIASALMVMVIFPGDLPLAVLLMGIIGVVLSFLVFNFSGALYMGNSGSHFLGFILAGLALLIRYAPLEREMALFSPLLILGFPIFDTVFLVLIRVLKKKVPFKKSNDHLALRFLALGFTKRKSLLVMLGITAVFSFSGVMVSRASNTIASLIIMFVVLAAVILAYRMSKVAIDG